MWHDGWHPWETRKPAAGCVPTGSLTPAPNPSMQSLAIPTTVAWQPGIYLKGKPHSNASHQPALPAWRKPLSCFSLLPHLRGIVLPDPGPQVHPNLTIHLPEAQWITLWLLYFSSRVEGSCYGHRSCQSAQLKSPLCLGFPACNVWAPMYKIPDFSMSVRQGLLSC